MRRLVYVTGLACALALLGSAGGQDDKKVEPKPGDKVDHEALFKKLDANGDGKLSLDEFKKLDDVVKPADPAPGKGLKGKLTPEMIKKFRDKKAGDKKPEEAPKPAEKKPEEKKAEEAPKPQAKGDVRKATDPLPRDPKRYDLSALDPKLQGLIDDKTVTGLGLIVVKDGHVIYEKALGDITADTVIPIASASKLPSVTAFMALVDQGKVGLDEKVSKYIPGWPEDKKDMTVRHTLSCTHGLPQQQTHLRDTTITLEDSVEKTVAAMRLQFEPGAAFSYGGNGYQTAGRVAERAAGKSWNEHFADALGKPLGFTAMTYGDTKNPWLGGGAASNLEDYAKLLVVHLDKGVYGSTRVLSAASVAEMQKDHIGAKRVILSPPTFKHYGLSWWISTPKDGEPLSEFTDPGAKGATPWIDTKHGYGAFLLINKDTRTGIRIWHAVRPVVVAEIERANKENRPPK